MPTSYTGLLGLALPDTGELSGTWGDTVNDYIVKYLDAAVAGAQTISGTQTAVTLSATNGSALVTAGVSGATGSAQYAIINCTGNPAGTLTVTVPTASKVYLVINATSTSQSVVVKPASNAGVTVPAGRAALIAWNGLDFVTVASNDAAQLRGTANGVLYFNGSQVGTSGSALTFDGTNLATTGTASAAKLIPTGGTATGNGMYLPSANTLGFSTNGVLNAVLDASGNLGIGTASPSNYGAGYNYITTNGASGSGVVFRKSGGSVGIADTFSNNFDLFAQNAALLRLGTGNAAKVTLDLSGNLGLGVTPSAWGANSTGVDIELGNGWGYFSALYPGIFANSFHNGSSFIYKQTAAASYYEQLLGRHQWYTAPSGTAGNVITFTERMRLDASGNLGIGTTSPGAKLDVRGSFSAATASGVANTTVLGGIQGTSNGYEVAQDVSNNLIYRWRDGANTEIMRLDASGNLGVGTTSPVAKLDVAGANGDGIQYRTSTRTIGIGSLGGLATLYAGSGSEISFNIGGELMRLDASGNLGIGTASPGSRLQSYAGTGIGAGHAIFGASATGYWDFSSGGNPSDRVIARGYDSSAVEKIRLDPSSDSFLLGGNLGIGTASPATALEIARGAAAAAGASFRGNGNSAANEFFVGQGGAGNGFVFQRANSYIDFGTNNTTRMRLDASGNLGIGTSSPSFRFVSLGGAIQLSGSTTAAAGLRVQTAAGLAGLTGINHDNNAFNAISFSTSASEAMRLDTADNLLVGYTSSNGAYRLQVNSQIFATSATIATSDGRYKENVVPLAGALQSVLALNPVQFDWKQHPVHNFDRSCPTIGFVAQEVQVALADRPFLASIVKVNDCVLEPAEYETIEVTPAIEEVLDDDGNVIVEAQPAVTEQALIKEAVTEEFLGIAEGNLIALLTAAIKEQQAVIESLRVRVDALESA